MGRDEFVHSHEELRQILPNSQPITADVRWNIPEDSKNDMKNSKDIDEPSEKFVNNENSNVDYQSLALWNDDFSHRPSWCDARLALKQIFRKKAKGNKIALHIRAFLQDVLFKLGCSIQQHYSKVLFAGFIVLLLFCFIGLQHARFETNIDKLWVEKGGRLDEERRFIDHVDSSGSGQSATNNGGGMGSNAAQYLVLIQTPRSKAVDDLLTVEDLQLHIDVLRNISQMGVELYGVNWTLSDICFKPEPPSIEGDMASVFQAFVDRIIPCITITPLDCFWDGSTVLGPFPPAVVPDYVTMFIPSLRNEVTWKMLDPITVIDDLLTMFNFHDLEVIKSLFVRAGVDHGYLKKPCIDPLHPECPQMSTNYIDICPVVEKFLHWSRDNSDPFNVFTYGKPSGRLPRSINPFPAVDKDNNSTAALEDDVIDDVTNVTAKPAKVLNLFGNSNSHSDSSIHDEFDADTRTDCEKYGKIVREILRSNKEMVKRFVPQLSAKRDFGKEITGGCSGFARNYMQWPEDLIVGGVHREANRIVRAEALQTVLMITSATDIYNRIKDSDKKKLNRYEWSLEAAENVLTAWQRNFTSYVYNHVNNTDDKDRGGLRQLHPFSGTSVSDMMTEFSEFNPKVIFFGYLFMLLYASVSLCSCAEGGVRSEVGLAVSGCFLVTLAGAAGLGFSMICQIPFNAATTQIVPFLSLGLGVDDMFLLMHNYKAIVKYAQQDEMGLLLKETGLSALLSSASNILAFFVGTILPIPALRDFCFQVGILLTFNLFTILTLFPAMITVDLIRRQKKRVDVLCCIRTKQRDKISPKATTLIVNLGKPVGPDFENQLPPISAEPLPEDLYDLPPNPPKTKTHSKTNSSSSENSIPTSKDTDCFFNKSGHHKLIENPYNTDTESLTASDCRKGGLRRKCGLHHWTLHRFVKDFYVVWLTKTPVKVVILLGHFILFSIGVIGCSRVTLGLELTDVVPKNTPPYAFLDARQSYFSFYPFNAVLKGPLDIASNQIQIRQYRNAIARVSYVVKTVDGRPSLPYWLNMLSEWLSNLQAKFDTDFEQELIDRNGSVPGKTPTNEAILAYKLLCNKGHEVECSRVGNTRLVDKDGNINPDGFYNYLTAWYHTDPMSYYVSQANISPAPPDWKNEDKLNNNTNLRIPPAPKPTYSQIPFFVNNLIDTPAIVDMIKKIRVVCDEYRQNGLETFPEGIPFTFWEQYLYLKVNLLRALGIVIGGVCVVVAVLLCSPWLATILGVVLSLIVVELAGFMGIVGLKLNAVSSVTLITAIGIGVEFTVHMALSFLTALGTKNERMARSLEHMFIPVLHGGLSTLLGVIMLAFSEFEFVVRYFFMVMTALIVLGLLNGLVLLPVLLSLIGPNSEVTTVDGSACLAPPSPELRKKKDKTSSSSGGQKVKEKIYIRRSDSLSTIAEEQESPSSSPAIVKVAPVQVVVHTGTSGGRRGSPLTVTAKAELNVQVQLGGYPTTAAILFDKRSSRRRHTSNTNNNSGGQSESVSTMKPDSDSTDRSRHNSSNNEKRRGSVEEEVGDVAIDSSKHTSPACTPTVACESPPTVTVHT